MQIITRIDQLARRPGLLWWIVFAYILVTGLLVQLVLLPFVFPAWHGGHGLIKGMDGRRFHLDALELAEKVREHGWGEWEPMPEGQLVPGVAAVFYVLIQPEPWSVLPVNAALGATAAVVFYLTLDRILRDRRKSLIAALPLTLLPSTLLWNAQFHNDNYAVPGVILILYGWTVLASPEADSRSRVQVREILAILTGSLLLGLVRSNILIAMLAVCLLVFAGLCLVQLLDRLRKKIDSPEFLRRLLNLGLAILAIGLLTGWFSMTRGAVRLNEIVVPDEEDKYESAPIWRELAWVKTPWLPGFMDKQLKELAGRRLHLSIAWKKSGSIIDGDIRINSAIELAMYLPRALQIGLFAPFPAMWFTRGYEAAASGTRAVAGLEMAGAYVCLSLLPYFTWRHRRTPAVWVAISICIAMILIYAFTVPNVGSLYRFRFPFYMYLVCMGLAGWMMVDWKNLPGKPAPRKA